ncbi:YncE family protein [Streptomyces tanashiensis]|uniref:YncE family protein n=1 Tax=Streptomyces tanashiensis TaxID=67367 RepID=A0ABY6QSJ1_9ACTN|nr:YncE family protein [Streptomyces tanashiensis]UZX19734.1 YncE family protein [Streptomyces tanashiensis]
MNTPNAEQLRVVANIPVGAKPIGVAVGLSDVYVTNSGEDTVSVIDPSTNGVSATINVGLRPEGVATDPQFGICVSNGGDNTVSMIDRSNAVIATVSVQDLFTPPPGMMRVAVDHFLSRAYVTHRGSGRVSIINLSDEVFFAFPFIDVLGPLGVAVDPASHRVYVTQPEFNAVSVIDPEPNGVIATIPVGQQPIGIAVDALRRRAYVANSGFNIVSLIDIDTHNVADIDVATGSTGATVDSRGNAYVTQFDGTVKVIDATSGSVSATIPVGSQPAGLALKPDIGRLYVANSGDGTVSVIDLAGG